MKRVLSIMMILALAGVAFAQEEGESKDEKDVPEAKQVVTEHSATIGGQKIDYKATAGTMLMKNDEEEPIALVGFTAYEKKGANKRTRPIMFAYNGGPGSASVWLHMGILGPQRAIVQDAGFTMNGPYERVENDYSIIDEVDLVMIDPVGTGFAKPVGEGKGEDFWGADQDIRSVPDFALNEYAPALLLGSTLPDERRQALLARPSHFTGLSEKYWDRANLRIDEGRFGKELQRVTGKTTGRIDSRFAGHMINRVGEHMDLPDELRENITLEYYEAGHMMYIHEPSMVKFKADRAKFVSAG